MELIDGSVAGSNGGWSSSPGFGAACVTSTSAAEALLRNIARLRFAFDLLLGSVSRFSRDQRAAKLSVVS